MSMARPARIRNRDKSELDHWPGMITHYDYGQLGPGIGQSQSSQGQSGPGISQVRARPGKSQLQTTPDEIRARHGNPRLT